MKSFKQYLREFAVQSTSDYVFDVPSGHSGSLKIPISGPMFKRIWPDTIRSTVFHVTDLSGLKRLKKLEGGKKSISAFFSMMSRYMETGVATSGGIVAELDADVLISARDDIMSQVDTQGRRWVEMSWFANAQLGRTGPEFGKVEKDLNWLIKNLVIKHLSPILGQTEVKKVGEFAIWGDIKRYIKGDGKMLRLLIKEYFDGVERLLKKHKKTMSHIFYSYAKSKRMTDNSWDEQIVNNIKVKKIHFIKQDTEKFPGLQFGVDQATEYADSKNWPIKTWDAAIDLEIYTREVVKKEQPPRNIAY
jgi:hypothetical protein